MFNDTTRRKQGKRDKVTKKYLNIILYTVTILQARAFCILTTKTVIMISIIGRSTITILARTMV